MIQLNNYSALVAHYKPQDEDHPGHIESQRSSAEQIQNWWQPVTAKQNQKSASNERTEPTNSQQHSPDFHHRPSNGFSIRLCSNPQTCF